MNIQKFFLYYHKLVNMSIIMYIDKQIIIDIIKKEKENDCNE